MSDTPSNNRRKTTTALPFGGMIFERAQSIGSSSQQWSSQFAAMVAILLHSTLGAAAATRLFDLELFAHSIQAHVADRLSTTIDIDAPQPEPAIEKEPEPAEEEEAAEETEPDDTPPPEAPSQEPADEAPPPAAAEAGKVLTSEPDPDEPLDLTADGFISGSGTRFAGGVTAAEGTAKKAVRHAGARAGGEEGAKGNKLQAKKTSGPPPVDKSRPAGIPKRANWNSCGFPSQATAEQMNQAAVRVVVVVGKDGRPISAKVLSSPGFGFDRHTERCAMRYRYPPGLDKNGKPTVTTTKPFMVRFSR